MLPSGEPPTIELLSYIRKVKSPTRTSRPSSQAADNAAASHGNAVKVRAPGGRGGQDVRPDRRHDAGGLVLAEAAGGDADGAGRGD